MFPLETTMKTKVKLVLLLIMTFFLTFGYILTRSENDKAQSEIMNHAHSIYQRPNNFPTPVAKRLNDQNPADEPNYIADEPDVEQVYHPECNSLVKPDVTSNEWVTLIDNDDILVYSAYLDRRMTNSGTIRILGAAVYTKGRGAFCQIWYDPSKPPDIAEASIDTIPEKHGTRYSPVYFLCDLPNGSATPEYVSVVSHKCSQPFNKMEISILNQKRQDIKSKTTFCVCVAPINNAYNNVYEFVEFIEVSILFGANKFIFYNQSIGPDLKRYIDHYMKEDLVEIYPWNIPLENTRRGIHNYGQLTALNDCAYKAMYKYNYVVYQDLDEIIVPLHDNNWSELISDLVKTEQIYVNMFSFQCLFFKKEWPDDPKYANDADVQKYKMQTLLKTKRELKIWGNGQRSKYMVKPEDVIMAGIHRMWRSAHKSKKIQVDPKDGLLFHYRFWEDPNKPHLLENRMHAFHDTIKKNIVRIHENVEIKS